eukprot:TRINITY_DN16232_c0_g1_i1.p1 TRINITY_DN16232_c0_g1~~TRINITY_DN16232_c0_g1_i1.p1  ORF type:complete len:2617 (+),score=632.40 TRINITY_DN16232_c0_g1_i1:92-7852(+)
MQPPETPPLPPLTPGPGPSEAICTPQRDDALLPFPAVPGTPKVRPAPKSPLARAPERVFSKAFKTDFHVLEEPTPEFDVSQLYDPEALRGAGERPREPPHQCAVRVYNPQYARGPPRPQEGVPTTRQKVPAKDQDPPLPPLHRDPYVPPEAGPPRLLPPEIANRHRHLAAWQEAALMPAETAVQRATRIRLLHQALKEMAAEAVPCVMGLVTAYAGAGTGDPHTPRSPPAFVDQLDAASPKGARDPFRFGGSPRGSKKGKRFADDSFDDALQPSRKRAEPTTELGPVSRHHRRLTKRMSLKALAGEVEYKPYSGRVALDTGNAKGPPGRRLVVGGLVYRFCGDDRQLQRYGSHEAAAKALAHRFRGLDALMGVRAKGLAPFPYLLVDYLGHRVFVTPHIPGVSEQSTVAHGSTRPGQGPECKPPASTDPEVATFMANAALALNLRGHWVGPSEDCRRFLFGPVDLEIHRSRVDNRLYVLRGSNRLFPPQAPNDKTTDGSWYLTQHLRPELVRHALREKLPRKPLALSSDAFSPFGDARRSECDFHVFLVSEALRTSMIEHLVDDIVLELWQAARDCTGYPPRIDTNALFLFPDAPKDRLGQAPMLQPCGLSAFCHRRGVNMRYLGAVQLAVHRRLLRVKALESADCSRNNLFHFVDASDPALPGGPIRAQAGFFTALLSLTVETLRTEMTARVLRDVLNADMRMGGNGLMEVIDHIFGDDLMLAEELLENRVAFWFDVVIPRIREKYGGVHGDYLDPFTLDDVHRAALYWRIQQLTGLRFERNAQVISAFQEEKHKFTKGLIIGPVAPIVRFPQIPPVQYPEGEQRYLLRQALSFVRLLLPPGRIESRALKERCDGYATFVQERLGSSFHRQDIDVLRWRAMRTAETVVRSKKVWDNIVFINRRAPSIAEAKVRTVQHALQRDPSKKVEFDVSEEGLAPWGVEHGQRIQCLAQPRGSNIQRTAAAHGAQQPARERTGDAAGVCVGTVIGVRAGWLWRHTDGEAGATAFNAKTREELDSRYGMDLGGARKVRLFRRQSQAQAKAEVATVDTARRSDAVDDDDEEAEDEPPAHTGPSFQVRQLLGPDSDSDVVFPYTTHDGVMHAFIADDYHTRPYGPGLCHGDILVLPDTPMPAVGGSNGTRKVDDSCGNVALVLGLAALERGKERELWIAWKANGVAAPLPGPPEQLREKLRYRMVGRERPPWPPIDRFEYEDRWYDCSERNLRSRFHCFFTQRLVFTKGPHAGAAVIVLGVVDRQLSVLLERSGYVYDVPDCRSANVLRQRHAPEILGVGQVPGAQWGDDDAGEDLRNTGLASKADRRSPLIAPKPAKQQGGDSGFPVALRSFGAVATIALMKAARAITSADNAVEDWSDYQCRSWAGDVLGFDARAGSCLPYGAMHGHVVRITKGRWLHRTGAAVGVRSRSRVDDHDDPCLWACIDGYAGAVPLHESAYCLAGGPPRRLMQHVGGSDVMWYDAKPNKPFRHVGVLGTCPVMDASDAACGVFGLYHGQRIQFAEHHEPSSVGTVLGVFRDEIWVLPDGMHAAVPLLGSDAWSVREHQYIHVEGIEQPQQHQDRLLSPGGEIYFGINSGPWKGSEPLSAYAGFCRKGHHLLREFVIPSVTGGVRSDCQTCGEAIPSGEQAFYCRVCAFARCIQCVSDTGPAGCLSYCSTELELIGFDIGRAAFAELPLKGLRPGDRVVRPAGHKCTVVRQRDAEMKGIVETYSWEKSGTFATVVGVHVGQLWINVDGEVGARPATAAEVAHMSVLERGPGSLAPIDENKRQELLEAKAAEEARAAEEAARDSRTLLSHGREPFPPPDPVQLSNQQVAPYLKLVRPETVSAVAQFFYEFGIPAMRRVLEWVLGVYGMGLEFRDSELDGFRKLAVAVEVFGIPVAVPLLEEFESHVQERREHWKQQPCRAIPCFADLVAFRMGVQRARRQVERESLREERVERAQKWQRSRNEAISKAADLHLTPQEMRWMLRPRNSIATVAENMFQTHQKVQRAEERVRGTTRSNRAHGQVTGAATTCGASTVAKLTAWTPGVVSSADGATLVAGSHGADVEYLDRPPPLVSPLDTDTGLLRYLCRDGILRAFALSPELTAPWGIPAKSRVRYTRGDLAGTTAVVLGVHDGKLWRYDECESSAVAHPWAATDKATMERTHGPELVETDVAVRQCDPFLFLRWDCGIGVFDVSPETCGQFGAYHGQRYLCPVTPALLLEAEQQMHGAPPPCLSTMRKDDAVHGTRLRRPWIITIIGVHEGLLWVALGDRSGAFPYIGQRPIREEWELTLLYTVATEQLGNPEKAASPRGSLGGGGAELPFKYTGRVRSGLGLRPRRQRLPTLTIESPVAQNNPAAVTWALQSSHRRYPGLRQQLANAAGHGGWDDADGFWAPVIFDISNAAFAMSGSTLAHGDVIEYSERPDLPQEDQWPFLRRGMVIGISRRAIWAHNFESSGAAPLRPRHLWSAKVLGTTTVQPLPSHPEDDPVGRRSRFRYLTAAGTVGLFETSDDVLTRYGVRCGDRIKLRHGTEWDEATVIGVRGGDLWICAPMGAIGTHFAKPLLGAKNGNDLWNQFAVTKIGRKKLFPFMG